MKQKPKMYWVITLNHEEDWFVFAASKRSAERFHEDFEGYNRGDALATLMWNGVNPPKPI
jgi:hypothetical protein